MTDEQRLQMITEQLILVRDNLFRGMSKSIQKLQARSINEVLELPNHTQSPPAQQEPVAPTSVEMQNAAANLALMRKMWGNADEPVAKVNDDGFIVETGLLLSPGTKLYTSPQPAQRTWVGLTNEEIQTEWVLTPQNDRAEGIWFGRRIEAKLRSKNEDRN